MALCKGVVIRAFSLSLKCSVHSITIHSNNLLKVTRPMSELHFTHDILVCKHYSSTSKTQYEQGQYVDELKGIREYFYYIDHQGQLFLDDARMKNFTSCFKEKDFLRFFFKRLKIDQQLKYPEFPYVSPCGPEMNYVRCDDLPIVFTKLMIIEGAHVLSYNNGEEKLVHPFTPVLICMEPETGRVYHPAPEKYGGVGLLKSSMALEWSKYFEYDSHDLEESQPPSYFTWHGTRYRLTNELQQKVAKLSALLENVNTT